MQSFPLNYPSSDHEQEIVSYFGEKNCFNTRTKQESIKTIFICFTNRCGSNFLANLISNTALFPEAGEFFNWDTVIPYSQSHNLENFDDYCLSVINETQKNNCFISKISFLQLMLLSKFGQIPNIFNEPIFIWIRRKDILGQAISYSIANQTKQWVSFEPGLSVIPDYRKQEILDIVQDINMANSYFSNYFQIFNANCLEIVYEDLCVAPEFYLKKIGKLTNHEITFKNLIPVKTQVQRSSINETFREKFRFDMQRDFSLKIDSDSILCDLDIQS